MFQALGVEIVSHSEDIDPARKASMDALQSDFELDVTVAEPIVLMPGAPAGVAPTATGLKMCGEQQQQTSAAVTSPAAVPVPVDVPDVVVAPPTFAATPPPLLPRRAASEPVVRGAPAAPPPQPAVPIGAFVERMPPAQPVCIPEPSAGGGYCAGILAMLG